jgi:hypothetical protein
MAFGHAQYRFGAVLDHVEITVGPRAHVRT